MSESEQAPELKRTRKDAVPPNSETVDFCADSSARPSFEERPTSLPTVPGFELLEVLGKGGMGVVYKARHEQLGRVVALKMILAGAHADKDDVQRFLAEAAAAAQLQHPNIVQLFDFGQHD